MHNIDHLIDEELNRRKALTPQPNRTVDPKDGHAFNRQRICKRCGIPRKSYLEKPQVCSKLADGWKTQKSKNQTILDAAKAAAERANNWIEFSHLLFDPNDGIVAKILTRAEDRERFSHSPEYKAIRELVEQLESKSRGP